MFNRIVVVAACLLAAVAFADRKPHALKGHPNLIKAEKELAAAVKAISKSQEANECVFGLEGGHGAKAKEAIEAAEKQVWEAAEWVSTHGKECAEYKPGAAKKAEEGRPVMKGHVDLKGHGNMIAAEKALIAAWEAIAHSQEANECVFGLEGGHGAEAKEAIDVAFKQVTEAADFVNAHLNECKKK